MSVNSRNTLFLGFRSRQIRSVHRRSSRRSSSYERQGWEYRVVSKKVDQPLTQEELNALGKDGWELVGIVPLLNTVQFYLKRIHG